MATAHYRKTRQLMNVTGIIMECNPFHEGHAYLLREARRRTEAEYIVVAMSGDYVQRGEPAVYDKYIRAEQILRGGADLVLEIPLYAACGGADYFARGGVGLLQQLGVVTDLCFGSESADLDYLRQSAEKLDELSSGTGVSRKKFLSGLREGLSYPAARAAALPGLPSSPNDLLAVEYCRALTHRETSGQAASPIAPHALPRIDVPSATQHRKELLQTRNSVIWQSPDRSDLPAAAGDAQVPLFPIGPDDFSDALLYALRMQESSLSGFADISGDLADRIRRVLPQYTGFSSFCDLLKTRNMTRTRISRCLLHILLQMKQSTLDSLSDSGMVLYARPLAINRGAAPLLSAIRRKARIPFLAKLSAAPSLLPPDSLSCLNEEIRAEELYTLVLQNVWNRTCGGRTAASSGKNGGSIPRAARRKLPLRE